MKISICGKGGSGKSVLTAIMAGSAFDKGLSVLVVDSDESNSGLFRMFGFEQPPVPLMEMTGGKAKLKKKMSETSVLNEDVIRIKDIPARYMQEKNGISLVCIGKIHQSLEGCACPMGVLCREFLKKLRLGENEIAIVDMEAGIEHFGRGIDTNIDAVLVVVDPSYESIVLAEKIKHLFKQNPDNVWAVLNKIDSKHHSAELTAELEKRGVEIIETIPYDSGILEACLHGAPVNAAIAGTHIRNVINFLLKEHESIQEAQPCV